MVLGIKQLVIVQGFTFVIVILSLCSMSWRLTFSYVSFQIHLYKFSSWKLNCLIFPLEKLMVDLPCLCKHLGRARVSEPFFTLWQSWERDT